MTQVLTLLLGALSLLLVAVGLLAIRGSGAHPRLAQRFAGAREHRVGELLDMADPPERPVRVTGRVRCADPLVTPDGESLVAYHRDVEVRQQTRSWRTIDRLRETRSFELWDHDGSLTVDPALAAEPLADVQYVSCADYDTLEELETVKGKALLSMAVFIGKTRLIDNFVLG